ncbi:MAG: hypothetical protein WC969_12525 [Elusimicrobiota bacterium]|jgi:uridine kinase
MRTKKTLAAFLAILQLAWSFSFGAWDALAQAVQTQQVSGQSVQSVPVGVAPVPGLGAAAIIPGTSLAPLSAVQTLPVLSNAPVLVLPQAGSRALVPSAARMPTLTRAALPAVQPAALPSAVVPGAVLAAPTAVETLPGAAPTVAETVKSVGQALESSGLAKEAPAESSKGAADKVFAALRGERLIEGVGEVSSPETVQAGTLSGRLRAALGARLAVSETASPAPIETAALPSPAPAQAPFWRSRTFKAVAGLAATAAVSAVLPLLSPYVGVVAAVGSLTLSSIGIPWIIQNFKSKPEDVKDVVMAGPLMWFAAASLLTLVSMGQGSSWLWNSANIAGIVESLTVIAQLNYFKKDPGTVKATLATVVGVSAVVALIASQVLMPLSVGLTAAFSAAMAVLWVLDAPQIRQNYHIFKNEGRAPQGISTLNKVLLVFGSLLHLYAALMGGDLRWAINASVAIVMSSIVLSQMYLPRAANAVLGPVVWAAEKVLGLFSRRTAAAPIDRARALVASEFQGTDYLRFKGADVDAKIAGILAKARALPGRSVIFLEAPTAAGKSTLARELAKSLAGRLVVFPVDNYYRPGPEVPKDLEGRPDFDQPQSLYLERAASDVKTLLAGGRIELPYHDTAAETTRFDTGKYLQLDADDVLVVDSIYASHEAFLKAAEGRRSLNVYLTAPTAVRLARRLKRDRVERGISVERNLNGWANILFNERTHILPLQAKADVVLNMMSEEELRNLPDSFAEILAQEWAAGGSEAKLTELYLRMLRASIKADTGR